MSAAVQQLSHRRTLRSEFLRNVAVLLSGHGLAMILSLLAAPVLGRIYSPTEYGVVGLFGGITSVFAVVGNWQYSQAIIIEKCDHRAYSMLPVCLVVTLFTSILSCIPTVLVLVLATDRHVSSEMMLWFALIPVYTGTTALIATFTALANRLKHYRLMTTVRLAAVIVGVATSIALGVLGFGSHGIFLGLFADQAVMIVTYIFHLRRQPEVTGSVRDFSVIRAYALLKRHRRFAIFSTPASFVGNFSMQIPIYVLGYVGQAAWVGVFTRGRQLVTMPVSLAAASVAQVYQQRAAVEFRHTNACWSVFRKTAFMLTAVGFVPAAVLVVTGPDLCEFVIGPDWRAAGEVARILAPMLLMRFICNPLATTFHVVGAQRDDLRFSLLTVAIVGAGVTFALLQQCSPYGILVGYSAGYFLSYLLYTLRAGWLAFPKTNAAITTA